MTFRGKVQSGIIVLGNGASLPDGTEVTVIVDEQINVSAPTQTRPEIWEKMEKLAEWVSTQPCDLPEDLASNHDHYLHGLPKRR